MGWDGAKILVCVWANIGVGGAKIHLCSVSLCVWGGAKICVDAFTGVALFHTLSTLQHV